MYSAASYQILLDNPVLLLVSAFSGFFVNLGSYLLVKRTSGITLKLITMARNGGLVLASALCFGETITTLEAVGYAGLLFFFAAYTVIKHQENEEAAGRTWGVATTVCQVSRHRLARIPTRLAQVFCFAPVAYSSVSAGHLPPVSHEP